MSPTREGRALLTSVQNYIHSYTTMMPHMKVIVAVSGGPDSMALLFALQHFRPLYQFSLIVAHVNHMLRGEEALRDQTLVQQQAKALGLPLYQTKVDVKAFQRRSGLSPEHAARQLRYHFLSALQQMLGARYIALGHTANDQAETLLVRLLRGSGPDGLAGIPVLRLPYIRPLLDVSRTTILSYLHSQRIPWLEDSSNMLPTYRRNQVRLELLPRLQQYNPQIIKRLQTLGELLQMDQSLLGEQVTLWLAKAVRWEQRNQIFILRDTLQAAPRAIQYRVLRHVVYTLLPANRPLGFQNVLRLHDFVMAGQHGQRHVLPGGVVAEHDDDTVLMRSTRALPTVGSALSLAIPGEVTLVGLAMRLRATRFPYSGSIGGDVLEAYIDLATIQPPLQIRFPQPGDHFIPLGMHKEKKLQDFFVDRKVRHAERAYVPLVTNQGNIVWVVGHRISESYKVHAQTKDVLYLQYRKL